MSERSLEPVSSSIVILSEANFLPRRSCFSFSFFFFFLFVLFSLPALAVFWDKRNEFETLRFDALKKNLKN